MGQKWGVMFKKSPLSGIVRIDQFRLERSTGTKEKRGIESSIRAGGGPHDVREIFSNNYRLYWRSHFC
jgi:hypothetical protein